MVRRALALAILVVCGVSAEKAVMGGGKQMSGSMTASAMTAPSAMSSMGMDASTDDSMMSDPGTMMAMSAMTAPSAMSSMGMDASTDVDASTDESMMAMSSMAMSMSVASAPPAVPAIESVFITITVADVLSDDDILAMRDSIATRLNVDIAKVIIVRSTQKTVDYTIIIVDLSPAEAQAASAALDEVAEIQAVINDSNVATTVSTVERITETEANEAQDSSSQSDSELTEASLVSVGVIGMVGVAGAALFVFTRKQKQDAVPLVLDRPDVAKQIMRERSLVDADPRRRHDETIF